MLRLRHFPLSPFCRKVRLVLNEKRISHECTTVRPWEMGVPVQNVTQVTLSDGHVLSDARAIAEYLEESVASAPLMPERYTARAEVRRWINWADERLWAVATSRVLEERLLKRFADRDDRQPDLSELKSALVALRAAMQDLERQLDRSASLVGTLSLADLAVAAHLSCLDYFGDVPWAEFTVTRDWYARIKSRPSFRGLLTDTLPGVPQASHYQDLDF
jgi:glutathione S-transferase